MFHRGRSCRRLGDVHRDQQRGALRAFEVDGQVSGVVVLGVLMGLFVVLVVLLVGLAS